MGVNIDVENTEVLFINIATTSSRRVQLVWQLQEYSII
jgi:hypothetical protein